MAVTNVNLPSLMRNLASAAVGAAVAGAGHLFLVGGMKSDLTTVKDQVSNLAAAQQSNTMSLMNKIDQHATLEDSRYTRLSDGLRNDTRLYIYSGMACGVGVLSLVGGAAVIGAAVSRIVAR